MPCRRLASSRVLNPARPGSGPSQPCPAPAPPRQRQRRLVPIFRHTPTFSWPSVNGKDENGDVEGESQQHQVLSLPQKPARVVRSLPLSLGRQVIHVAQLYVGEAS